MAEIDFTNQANGLMTLNPGNDYLIMRSFSTLKTIKWELVGDQPFEINVKGVTLFLGFIPNPFNSGWKAADGNYEGHPGWFGRHREDAHVSLFVVVRTNSHDLRLRFTGAWEPGGGGITIPF